MIKDEMLLNIITEFDEMGYCPTTLCKNPDEEAKQWKEKLILCVEENEKDVIKRTARKIFDKIKVELLCADMLKDRPKSDYRFRMIDLMQIARKAVEDVGEFNLLEKRNDF